MSAQDTVGKLIDTSEGPDAIHIALAPVVAGEDWLSPGDDIGFVYGSTTIVKRKERCYDQKTLGIVDPFLLEAPKEGQRFWMFLLPNTITGLRHLWTHPAFGQQALPSNDSELWLRKFADSWNFDYDELIALASGPQGIAGWGGKENYIVAMGIDLHSRGELGEEEPLFWKNLEVMTGKRFDENHRENFGWSCSC